MTPAELLQESFQRVLDDATSAVQGLSPDQLAERPGGGNSIAWLVWHLARVQDDHVAEVAGVEQVWTAGGRAPTFADRFALPLDVADTGYGHGDDEVGSVRADAELLTSYLSAVHEQTREFVAGLGADDLDRVVDDGWDPPVTLGVRLASVVNDGTQHVGQAAYVRGVLGA